MRYVESRRWTAVIAAVIIGAIGGSLVGFVTTPRQRANAEPQVTTTTAAPRQHVSHATVTLVPPSSRFTQVGTPGTSRHATSTTPAAPSSTQAKRTTSTTTTTSTTLPPTSSSSSTSSSEPETSTTVEATTTTPTTGTTS